MDAERTEDVRRAIEPGSDGSSSSGPRSLEEWEVACLAGYIAGIRKETDEHAGTGLCRDCARAHAEQKAGLALDAARAEEREACAKLAEEFEFTLEDNPFRRWTHKGGSWSNQVAAAIRARGGADANTGGGR